MVPRSVPVLVHAAVDRMWAGIIPTITGGLPIVDRLSDPEGLIVAAGHQNGNTTGHATGELVATPATGGDVPQRLAELAYRRSSLTRSRA